MFNRYTKHKVGPRNYRLLIINSYSSYITKDFLDYSIKNRIFILIFLPHLIHRLQPLDISLFNPLAKYYNV
jgi:hypothetical protein